MVKAMTNSKNTVAIDTDFITHIAETRMETDSLLKTWRAIFDEVNLAPAMHALVCKNELSTENAIVKKLFEESIVTKINFDSIFGSDNTKKQYYLLMLSALYWELKRMPFPFSGEEMLTNWRKKESLGEVHSLSMCLTCGFGIFLSDDEDSKVLENYINFTLGGKIKVYERKALVKEHTKINDRTPINKTTRSILTHV